MSGRWEAERGSVLETARELARLGLVSGASGNVSLRLREAGRDLLAITPTQRPYATMTVEEIVVVDYDGEPVEGELAPSSELLLHVGLYRARDDVGAVVHTHSIYASVCAVAALEVPPIIDEMVIHIGGSIPVADYAFPGSQELADAAVRALSERNAVLLRNHGVVAVGRDLAAALDVAQLVERVAQVFILASLLGGTKTLPPEVVAAEQQLFHMRQKAQRREG